MKAAAVRLMRIAEDLGYRLVDVNSKGARRFEHPAGPVVLIPPSLEDHGARRLERTLRTSVGQGEPAAPKRNAIACKQRHAADRARTVREQDRHQARLDALLAERDQMLAGHGAVLTGRDVHRIETEIERSERELARLTRLMTEVPAGADHSGTARPARHRGGAR